MPVEPMPAPAAPSRTIGIREAKARLSYVLRCVGQGTEWVVTDRGRPVAKVVPIPVGERSQEDILEDLERRGIIGPKPLGRPLPPLIRLKSPGLAQQMLQEDRDRI